MKDSDLSKYLCLILRHNPKNIMEIDIHGYADVEKLIDTVNSRIKKDKLTLERLNKIVAEDNKGRYSFNEEHTKIRCVQGHSIYVDLELEDYIPTSNIYHGTTTKKIELIKNSGKIIKMSRQFVHLTTNKTTAIKSGSRWRNEDPYIVEIDAVKMHQDGYKFYIAENGVILTNEVPSKYFVENNGGL